MIGNFIYDTNNNIINSISLYQPSVEIKEFTNKVKQDYNTGYLIMHKEYAEFNDMTILGRMDIDQKAFNSYVEPKSLDPDKGWRKKVVRPITRNKLISIAAQLTANILFPNVFAQNKADEEDKASAQVMRDLIEFNIKNSNYENAFLFGIISALINPAIIMKVEMAEVLQTIKQKHEDGSIGMKGVLDEFFSGLQYNIVPLDEFLITNIYEYDLQKQKAILRKRYIDYTEAEGTYGKHKNFIYVRPGIKILYNSETGTFYESMDESMPTAIEEVIYYNRREDIEVPFINGIYMGKENVDSNLMKHRRISLDKDGNPILIPVYPFAKSGYEPIDERRFFYYKSAAFKIAPEQDLIDTMYRMMADGTFLDVFRPLIIAGGGRATSSVIYPGAVTPQPQNAQVTPLQVGNVTSLYNAMEKIEASMTESTQSNVRAGMAEPGSKTAYEISRMEMNARIQMGLFGKMIGQLVIDIGYLTIDKILQHQTIGLLEETLGEAMKIKYRQFLIPNQIQKGKKITKKIVFTDEYADKQVGYKEGWKIMKEEGGYDANTRIYKVNPYLFSRMKFLLSIDPDNLMPKNKAFERAMNLDAYARGAGNPYIDQEAWTRDLLVETIKQGESDKYMVKNIERIMQGMIPQQTESKPISEQVVGAPTKSLKKVMSEV